jgi:hypothetical protein
VLVDAHQGEEQGTILHHPLFEDLLAKQQSVPGELLSDAKYHVPRSLLEKHEDAAYHDPLGDFDDRNGLSKVYQRRWLAAAAPVLPPIGADEHSESGLMVVMQSDYHVVVRPARELGGQFVKNSFWMLVVMVTVLAALWYIVVRMFREPRAGLNRPATPVPESTPVHAVTTLLASRRE